MLEAPQRAAIRGPTFIRLLARLTATDVPSPTQPLSDRLSHWIDWTHAVALSTALDSRPESDPLADPFAEPASAEAVEADCARVRAALTRAIHEDPAFDPAARRGGASASAGAEDSPDYLFFRQRYLFLQQSMDTAIGLLRSRLRDALAPRSTELARLAAVDASMERALARRERRLLAAAPTLLGPHFERLRASAPAISPSSSEPGEPATVSDAWLDSFRRDMRNLLLAELDVRLQPAEGLLSALRTHLPG